MLTEPVRKLDIKGYSDAVTLLVKVSTMAWPF